MPHTGLYLYPLIFFSYFLFFSLIFVKRYSTASWCKTKAYCKTWALPLVSCLYWHQGKFPFFHFKKSKLVTVDIITYQRQVLEPCQTSEMKHLAKEVNGFQLFRQALHLPCLVRWWMHLWKSFLKINFLYQSWKRSELKNVKKKNFAWYHQVKLYISLPDSSLYI